MNIPKKRFSFLAPISTLVLLLLAFAILGNTEAVALSAERAYRVCLRSLIPTLFPFMILGDLWSRCNQTFYATKGAKWRTAAACVLQGALFGFPIAAAAAVQQVQKKNCSPRTGAKLLLLSNNPGPAFLIAGVGVGLNGSIFLGVLFYLGNWASSAIAYCCFRKKIEVSWRKIEAEPYTSIDFGNRMRGHAVNMLYICGCVLFFSVLNGVLAEFLPPFLAQMITAFSEIGTAAAFFSAQGNFASVLFLAFSIGFGGCSVLLQTAPYLDKLGLSLGCYVKYKLLQGVVLTLLFLPIAFL